MFTHELAPVAGSLTVSAHCPTSADHHLHPAGRRSNQGALGGWPRWWSPWSPDQDPPVRRNRGHPPGVCARAHPRTMSRDRHRSG